MADNDCLFCRIIAGEIPAQRVYEDEHALVFRDISPQAPVHYLAIPRQHYASVHEVPDGEMGLIAQVLTAVKKVVEQEGLDRQGYRLVVNSGEKAGQAVYHIHVHILSGRKMQWPPG